MAAWRNGYQASAPVCRSGDGRPAEYNLVVRRDGKVREVRKNLCRRCADRQAAGAAVTNDFVSANRIDKEEAA